MLDRIGGALVVNRGHPLLRGAAAWWLAIPSLNYGGARWYDLIGANHGTRAGATVPAWRGTDRPGGLGHLRFDGATSYVNCGAPSFPGAITVSAWIKADSLNFYGIVSNFDSSGGIGQFDLELLNDGTFYYEIANGSGFFRSWQTAAGAVSAGTWHHVVAAHDGTVGTTGVRLFVDGVSRSLTVSTGTGGAPAVPASAGNTAIGRYGDINGGYFTGVIDDVRLYRRALTDAEAWSAYDLSRRGYPGLLARSGVAAYAASAPATVTFPWSVDVGGRTPRVSPLSVIPY